MEIKKVYGSLDTAADSCVLLYDFFGNSYAGEPTTNLFSQPTGNAGFAIKPTNTGRAFYKLDYSIRMILFINIIMFLRKQILLATSTDSI